MGEESRVIALVLAVVLMLASFMVYEIAITPVVSPF
jgi:hypothetical protein